MSQSSLKNTMTGKTKIGKFRLFYYLLSVAIIMRYIFYIPFLVKLAITKSQLQTAPKIRVNLYEKPVNRWYNAFQTLSYKNKNEICDSLEEIVDQLLPVKRRRYLSSVVNKIKNVIPREYLKEIQGLHRATKKFCRSRNFQKITVNEYYFLNLLYELTPGASACTSIMTYNKITRNVFSGRNMDYGFPGMDKGPLTKLTYDVDFYESEFKLLYKGTTFFGYVGLWTAFKPNQFSVSMNERRKHTVQSYQIMQAAAKESKNNIVDSEVMPISLLARKTIEECADYHCAFNKLEKTKTPAASYVVISGRTSSEGALLTKSSQSTDVERVDSQKFYQNDWYLLQTNFDQNKTVPYHDSRRKAGHRYMDAIGSQNIDLNELKNILLKAPLKVTFPSFNTIYTTVMGIKQGIYETVVHF